MMLSPWLFMDRQRVLGTLRATGSRDPDVLHAMKTSLLLTARFPRLAGASLMILGVLASFTVIGPLAGGPVIRGAVIGIPLVLAGGWLRHRGNVNLATIEAACEEYAKAPLA